MDIKAVWLCSVVFLISSIFGENTQNDNSAVTVPEIPAMFQAEILITVPDENRTYHSQVYFNRATSEGAVVIEQPHQRIQIIYNFNADTNQTLLIKDQNCVELIDESVFVFGPHKYFSPGYLIGIAENMSIGEANEQQLGIAADQFYVDNLTLPLINATDVHVESFWSKEDGGWQFPYCPSITCNNWRVPLTTIIEAEVNSKITMAKYVYYNYRETNVDLEAFQIPDGIYCPNVKSKRPLPRLEFDFVTGIEMHSSEFEGVESVTLYYNGLLKATRTDGNFAPYTFNPDDRAHEYLKEIIDYQRGFKYQINATTNECNGIQKVHNLGEPKNLHKVYDFLAFDVVNEDDAFYVGKRKVSNIECDMWVIGDREPQIEILMQICVTNITKKLPDGKSVVTSIPLFINQTNMLQAEHVSRLFYNFDIGVPNWSYFDTSVCIPEIYKKRFQIELAGEHIQVKQNPSNFFDAVRATIKDVTNITALRIQDMMIDYTMYEAAEYVLFTATLLEDIDNVEGILEDVEYYEAEESDVPTNDDVYRLISDAIYSNNFEVNYKPNDNYPYNPYIGRNIRDDIIPADPDGQTGTFEDSFSVTETVDLKGSGFDYQLSGQSMNECGAACVESNGLVCEAFAYCRSKGICKISHLHYENMTSDQTVKSGGCSLYSRDYYLDYEESNHRRLNANEIESSVAKENLSSKDCARKCSLNPGNTLPFYCEGFNMCTNPGRTSSCEFRSRHILNVDPGKDITTDKNCSYFSRDYYEDFMVHVNQRVKDSPPQRWVQVASAKECARLCVMQADSGSCKAFEMCTNTETTGKTKCNLLEYGRGDPNITLETSTECDHYSRERMSKHTPPQPPVNLTSTPGTGSTDQWTGSPATGSDQSTGPVTTGSGYSTGINSTGSTDVSSVSKHTPPQPPVNLTSTPGMGSTVQWTGSPFTGSDQSTGPVTTGSGYSTGVNSTGSTDVSSVSPPLDNKNKSVNSGYGSGEMAALGIGMVILGFFLGAAGMILFMRIKLHKIRSSRY